MTSLGTATATTMSTKLSQTWFSEKERPISTALIGLSPVLGGLSGQALSPLVMNDNPDNLPILNIVTTAPLILTCLSSWFVLKTAIPPSPPSRSAERLMEEKPPSISQILNNLLKVVRNRSVLTIIICQGLGAGLMNTILSQLAQLMCSRNYTIQASTLTSLLNIAVGFLGISNIRSDDWISSNFYIFFLFRSHYSQFLCKKTEDASRICQSIVWNMLPFNGVTHDGPQYL